MEHAQLSPTISKNVMKSRFQAFQADPIEQLRVKIRRVRAKQIQEQLSLDHPITVETFNKDIWSMQSSTKLHGKVIPNFYDNLDSLSPEVLQQIDDALDQWEPETETNLELHGNYVWKPGSSIYGPRIASDTDREDNIQFAILLLTDDDLSPDQKVDQIAQIPGFGLGTASGLVMLFYPKKYAICNSQSQEAMHTLGYEQGTNAQFQKDVHKLKDELGAADFLELDWFLYLENNRDEEDDEEDATIDTIDTNRIWWVNQGGTYTSERAGQYLWAPKLNKIGVPTSHHVSMASLKVGDTILHYSQREVLALSRVHTSPQDAHNPFDKHQDTWQRNGYLVQSAYHDLSTPIGLDAIPIEWRLTAKAGPFDKNGDVNQGYLYPLPPEFATNFLRKFADQLPTSIHNSVPELPQIIHDTVSKLPAPIQETIPKLPLSTPNTGPVRMFKIAPADGARLWQECLENNVIRVGWDEIGDICHYPSEAAFKEEFPQIYPYYTKSGQPNKGMVTKKSDELWTFFTLKPGDLIAANDGTTKILAVGTVVAPGYEWQADLPEYRHSVHVQWDTSLAKSIPEQGYWPFVTVQQIDDDLAQFILHGTPMPITAEPVAVELPPTPEVIIQEAQPEYRETKFDYIEPSFSDIEQAISTQGLRLEDGLLRRYHLALKTRGFVILSGISGTGKTWLAEAYAQSVGAKCALVPVAPNWTTNEDLLGYLNPLSGQYYDTEFSCFLRCASHEYHWAQQHGQTPPPYHVILDEMNLARIEYYFAKFLSLMEYRARHGQAPLNLGTEKLTLPPNLKFIGTVNIDETTHGFADKVYDRAQLLELTAPRHVLSDHIGDVPHRNDLLGVWDAVAAVAPFAFRVVDEIQANIAEANALGIPWEEALDEQLLQKVLPKLKGTDLRLGLALQHMAALPTSTFPRTVAKAAAMHQGFTHHGFASFF